MPSRPVNLSIYLFHGVVEKEDYPVRNYNRKHISKKRFREFLASKLESGGTPVSMSQVTKYYTTGEELPNRPFLVTFDDGFENNATVAAPVLKELNIPAIFYVTTSWLGTTNSTWIDYIENAIESTSKATMQLPWSTDELSITTEKEKINALNIIRKTGKADQSIDLNKLSSDLSLYLSGIEEQHLEGELYQKLDASQIKALADDPLFEIGGHTHTHPIMSFLDQQELDIEIDQCLGTLREITGQVIEHFAYPEGLEHCFNDGVISSLKTRGIISSPSAIHGTNDGSENLFNLKRIMVT